MQSVIRVIVTLLLSTVLIVPATAFQSCCCDRIKQSAELPPCCARAKLLSQARSASPDVSSTDEVPPTDEEPHRCPCVKHVDEAVSTDRVEPPATQDLEAGEVSVITLSEHAADSGCCACDSHPDTGPPLRVVHGVWRL